MRIVDRAGYIGFDKASVYEGGRERGREKEGKLDSYKGLIVLDEMDRKTDIHKGRGRCCHVDISPTHPSTHPHTHNIGNSLHSCNPA